MDQQNRKLSYCQEKRLSHQAQMSQLSDYFAKHRALLSQIKCLKHALFFVVFATAVSTTAELWLRFDEIEAFVAVEVSESVRFKSLSLLSIFIFIYNGIFVYEIAIENYCTVLAYGVIWFLSAVTSFFNSFFVSVSGSVCGPIGFTLAFAYSYLLRRKQQLFKPSFKDVFVLNV